ncbi:hypothetical protein RhiirA1_399055 [Rhizophagus irregularis]|uniref:Uncharacterized protein n=1 Tax=Rhizophagus irregularis TaxID=588596 RepID=A0A2N0RBB4_9GLOM|nr:hypothetical protein RhiirA1_399055 [Rhizophagus irregularis]
MQLKKNKKVIIDIRQNELYMEKYSIYNVCFIAYHSIQFDFDLQDGIITEVKDESNKRIYFNGNELFYELFISIEGQDDLTINPKKVKLNNNDKEEQDELKVSDSFFRENIRTKETLSDPKSGYRDQEFVNSTNIPCQNLNSSGLLLFSRD